MKWKIKIIGKFIQAYDDNFYVKFHVANKNTIKITHE